MHTNDMTFLYKVYEIDCTMTNIEFLKLLTILVQGHNEGQTGSVHECPGIFFVHQKHDIKAFVSK